MSNNFSLGKSVLAMGLMAALSDQPLKGPKEKTLQLIEQTRGMFSDPKFDCNKDEVGFECENDPIQELNECLFAERPQCLNPSNLDEFLDKHNERRKSKEECFDQKVEFHSSEVTVLDDKLSLYDFHGQSTHVSLFPFSGTVECDVELSQSYVSVKACYTEPKKRDIRKTFFSPLMPFIPLCEVESEWKVSKTTSHLSSENCNVLRGAAHLLFAEAQKLPVREDNFQDTDGSVTETVVWDAKELQE